jgi:hypothetical protein
MYLQVVHVFTRGMTRPIDDGIFDRRAMKQTIGIGLDMLEMPLRRP